MPVHRKMITCVNYWKLFEEYLLRVARNTEAADYNFKIK